MKRSSGLAPLRRSSIRFDVPRWIVNHRDALIGWLVASGVALYLCARAWHLGARP